jgi:hypothetical protein
MKTKHGLFFGIAVVLMVAMLTVAGCATMSTIGGTADTHGLISSAKTVSGGGELIASYGVILGLFDSGYENYVSIVKQAESAGKQVTTVTTSYLGFYVKVTAYAR